MEYNAYLLTHFVGIEETADCEQVYMSVSPDGENWEALNGGECVLKSTVGEQGIRDPFCIRKKDGSGFYLIATDLSIYGRLCTMQNEDERGNIWPNSKTRKKNNPTPGSQSIVVWESTDLCSWSKARLVRVAVDDAGCTFAPKCIYDKTKNSYMVFWASTSEKDDYKLLRVYRSYTDDFITFSEPEIWIDRSGEGLNALDVMVLEKDGRFYRGIKTDKIELETADTLCGEWKRIDSNIHIVAPKHEGAALFKKHNTNKVLLLLDCLKKSEFGYHLFETEDIDGGSFTRLKNSLSDKRIYRHGGVMPITMEEYESLKSYFS